MDFIISSDKNVPSSPAFSTSPLSSPKIQRNTHSPVPRTGSTSYSYGQQSPKLSPHTPRRDISPSHYDLSPQRSSGYTEISLSPSPTAVNFDQSSRSGSIHSSHTLLSPYDSRQMGRKSPRPDRSPSPLSFNPPMSSTLPRNFGLRHGK